MAVQNPRAKVLQNYRVDRSSEEASCLVGKLEMERWEGLSWKDRGLLVCMNCPRRNGAEM